MPDFICGDGPCEPSSVYFLSIIFKLFAKTFAGEEYTALHCAERQIEFLCDLVIFVSRHKHVEGDAVVFAEGIQSHADLLHSVRAFGSGQA